MTFICQQTATESHAHINAEQLEAADMQIKYVIWFLKKLNLYNNVRG